MKKINKVLKQLSDLYEFNRRLKGLKLKKRLEPGKPIKKNGAVRQAPSSTYKTDSSNSDSAAG